MAAKKASTRRKGGRKSGAKAGGQGGDQGAADTGVIEGKAQEVKKKQAVSPFTFLQQVRAEMSKVTWTTRNETMVSTIMVLIMVAIMAAFFFLVDQGLRFGVCLVLPDDCAAATGV